MHRNHLTIAVTLTKVGSFYTLNKLGRVVTLESPLHCCHPYQGWIILCFLMNLGWGTLESPHHHCHPYQGWIILHFLINQMGGGRYIRITVLVSLSACLSTLTGYLCSQTLYSLWAKVLCGTIWLLLLRSESQWWVSSSKKLFTPHTDTMWALALTVTYHRSDWIKRWI